MTDSTNHTIQEVQCQYPDCRHKWIPRSTNMPKACPECKRYGWNKETANDVKNNLRRVKKLMKTTK